MSSTVDPSWLGKEGESREDEVAEVLWVVMSMAFTSRVGPKVSSSDRLSESPTKLFKPVRFNDPAKS